MTSVLQAAGVAGIVAAVLTTAGSDLSVASPKNALDQRQPVTITLSTNASATTYWVRERDGWHVVTTVDTVIGQGGEVERHAIVRFSAVLEPGQSQLISVPVAVGEQQQTLRIRRVGDRIEVARVGDGA